MKFTKLKTINSGSQKIEMSYQAATS